MPWTVADVDRFKKGLSAGEKRQWVNIANSALRSCLREGGRQSSCETSAIRQANGTVGRNEAMENYSFSANNYRIREEMHEGKKHLVVPVVMMVEGVHNGSAGPLLHLAEDLGRFPGSWNGIPVTVPHPEVNGSPSSANTPHAIERFRVGRVFNTKFEDNKLKAEAWLDENRVRQFSPEVLGYIRQARPLDVSIGVFTEDEPTSGEWNGEEYLAIARNHRPDHLALLPGEQGACSWADGCGIRVNKGGGDLDEGFIVNALRFSGTESTPWSAPTLGDFGVDGNWSNISASDRSEVASHYLIGSGSVDTFGDLKFPVVNPRTNNLNENALRAVIGGRGAQVRGVSAEVRAAARRRAYRLLNSEFDAELEIPTSLKEYGNLFKALIDSGYSVVPITNEQGYRDIVQKIQEKLDGMDDNVKVHFLVEVFEDRFIYEVRRNDGGGSSFYQRTYDMNDETVEFTGEPVEVQRKVEFVSVQNKKGDLKTMADKTTPCCPEKVEMIIQTDHLQFNEADREYLLTLKEERIDEILAIKAPEIPTGNNNGSNDFVVTEEQAKAVLANQLADPEKAMALFPAEMREQMKYGMKLHQDRKIELIDQIVANSNEVYKKEDLKDINVEALEKLAKALTPNGDYSLQSEGRRGTDNVPLANKSAGGVLLPFAVSEGGDK